MLVNIRHCALTGALFHCALLTTTMTNLTYGHDTSCPESTTKFIDELPANVVADNVSSLVFDTLNSLTLGLYALSQR